MVVTVSAWPDVAAPHGAWGSHKPPKMDAETALLFLTTPRGPWDLLCKCSGFYIA